MKARPAAPACSGPVPVGGTSALAAAPGMITARGGGTVDAYRGDTPRKIDLGVLLLEWNRVDVC
ncbi:MAG: hypothetical protein WAO09_07585 [Candidatus Dormiibacterota bacterium]